MKVLEFFKVTSSTDLKNNSKFIEFVNKLSKANNTCYNKFIVKRNKLKLYSNTNELVIMFGYMETDYEVISNTLIHSL